ncbi:MAG TPA: PPC domain-containing DNA-binding protein [Pyrinomonadaceae bacterium]|nr:PPC domain-containing DNA-binding protein [Pyrinomonadaceae bacterium]
MQWVTLSVQGGRKFVLVFETGDEVAAGLLNFARENDIKTAFFVGVGACQKVTLGFFDLEKKDYEKRAIDEQVEVMSIVGNIATYENEPKIHAHMVIGKRDSIAHGGHLIDAVVRPTLEVFVTESPVELVRALDVKTNLPLIDLNAA